MPRRRLAAAVALLASSAPAPAAAAEAGAPPTFSGQVAAILFKNCLGCHRPGQIAAAAPLDSYPAAKRLASAIKSQVVARAMPPWPADPAHSLAFRNDARLNQRDIDVLAAWVDGGAPEGPAAASPAVPQGPQEGWQDPQGRKPDVVISLPQVSVQATGEIPYIQLLVKVPLLRDRWISAMQVRPGNGVLVHHMGIAEIALADGVKPQDLQALDAFARRMGMPSSASMASRPAVVDPENTTSYDMLGVYTPGSTYETYGEGNAKLLKGGENLYINFNIHYTTTGKPETDRSQFALWFQPQAPRHQLFRIANPGKTLIAAGKQLLTDDPGTKAEGSDVAITPIPPYAENYEVIGMTAYVRPVTIFQFQPHAHLRGKDFTYTVFYPDGREQTVLSVPKYDFHWQIAYSLATPLALPAGSKLVVTAHYDNSVKNAHLQEAAAQDPARRCGPEKVVYFRDQNQSWDEMFSPIIQYAVDREERAPPTSPKAAAALKIVAAVGCLTRNPSGAWVLTRAGRANATDTQSTSRAELSAMAARVLGQGHYLLVGAGPFKPEDQGQRKVAVKGVLIEKADGARLNVTSLQPVGAGCK